MSISTSFYFLNGNDPEFLEAKHGHEAIRDKWEEEWGRIEDRPGARLEVNEDDVIEYTEDEYGGWIIPVDKIPKNTTHIVVARG